MPKLNWKIILIILAIVLIIAFLFWSKRTASSAVKTTVPAITATSTLTATTTTAAILTPPLSDARARVTKKPFGLKVSPGHSPVTPERFSGYHTGTDFEILPGEENKDVTVSAVCSGPLIFKKTVSSYGGVAIQKCQIAKQIVTVLYGHLKLSSIKPKINEQVATGTVIAILGKGYSAETGGERKHLHLGIHKGSSINLLGYVAKPALLSGWLNPLSYLP